jgi:hypothetical protein
VFHHGPEYIFYEKMHFGIRHLLFQATNDRCGEYNITNGGKPYDEEFRHG